MKSSEAIRVLRASSSGFLAFSNAPKYYLCGKDQAFLAATMREVKQEVRGQSLYFVHDCG